MYMSTYWFHCIIRRCFLPRFINHILTSILYAGTWCFTLCLSLIHIYGSIIPGGIEAISSGTAITSRAVKAGLDVKHAGEVNDLAKAGNEVAKQIMDDAKEYLANFIGVVYGYADPEIVILGGSVALKIDGFVAVSYTHLHLFGGNND